MENKKKNSPLERIRHTWQDVIVMDLKEIGWMRVDRIYLDLDKCQWRAIVNMVMKIWVS